MELDLNEIKEKLVDRLRPSGWADKLKGFILSSDFDKIIGDLYTLSRKGKKFTPVLKQVFRAFEECPWNDLQVVMIGQDPYPTMYVADGIAFSCGNTKKVQPSLDYMFQALTADGITHSSDPDLTRWSNQGILLLNYSFTCEIGKPGTHYHIWKDFMAYTLDIINSYNKGLVFVFMGKKAQELAPLIGDQHHKIMTFHPISAGYSGTQWDSKDCFNQINKILKEQTKTQIIW